MHTVSIQIGTPSVQYIIQAITICIAYAMELRHLRYFLAVAQERNVTRAAARIGISQPPLSQQIKELEQEIGTPLFVRTPHGVELTDAGQAFLQEAERVLGGAERARTMALRAARGEMGQLRVGFTGSAAFNPVVARTIRDFRRTHPQVLLTLEEVNTTRLLDGLSRQQLDAAFIRPGLTPIEGMALHRFPDESMKVALPSGHPLARQTTIRLAQLADEPFVLFPRTVGLSLFDEVINACRRAGFEPRIDQVAPQISSVVNLVAAELGLSVVPASICQVQVAGVHYVDIEGDAPVARLALASRETDRSAVVSHFTKLALSPPG